jgi:hypothetical protein
LVAQQYGFQKVLLTDNASSKFTNFILKVWNKKMYVYGIFCGLAMAFDCVNHEVLLFNP